VNPRFHDEFVALCALFYSGEITDEEWALLQVHIAYCDSCRQTFEEFKHVAKEVIPVMATAAAADSTAVPHESPAAFEDAERRLMGRLVEMPARPAVPVSGRKFWPIVGGALAACLAVLVAFAAGRGLRKESAPPQEMHGAVAAPQAPATPAPNPSNDQQVISRQKADEIARLRQEIDLLKQGSKKPDSTMSTLEQRLLAEQAQRQQITSEKESLMEQLTSAQTNIQALQGRLSAAEANTGEQTTQVAALQTKVKILNAALEDANSALESKDRVLALDKDFLAHDKDIRDLIGARNLYIADIFDTTESGKTAKPFGRIFYTQDRSLVFYGFDLEKQAGLSRAVAFQAWGSGADHQPVSLGLFYQDDNHKRWVVRCDDAKTLARMNMVFVTIEPPGGSSKPTGKQLLRAYLQIQPNHP
jgi:hypothetical protein